NRAARPRQRVGPDDIREHARHLQQRDTERGGEQRDEDRRAVLAQPRRGRTGGHHATCSIESMNDAISDASIWVRSATTRPSARNTTRSAKLAAIGSWVTIAID